MDHATTPRYRAYYPFSRGSIQYDGYPCILKPHLTAIYSSKFPDSPIYTLQVPRSKIYIVTSPSLVSAIDRHAKTISFAPYVFQFVKRVLLPTQICLDALANEMEEKTRKMHGGRLDSLEVMHDALGPGDDLEKITKAMLASMSQRLDSVARAGMQGDGCINLFGWVRELVTRSSTDAIYGTNHNPFRDPEVVKAFWYGCDNSFA